MEKKTVNELPGTPSLYKEVLRSDWDKAQATIEQQAREIERLNSVVARLNGGNAELCSQVRELEHKMDYYKGQQPGVVLPERSNERGSDGNLTYEAVAHNRCLEEVARLNSSPVSAKELLP